MGRKINKDWQLWEQVKRSTRPLHTNRPPQTCKGSVETYTRPVSKPVPRPSRIIKPYAPEPAFRLKLVNPSPTLDESIGKKISRGKVSIDARIDLHGLTQEEAYTRLYQVLDMAYASGYRTVLVITGKGKLGDGILRQAVPRWLGEPEFSEKVIGAREAHGSHGGGGALYVRLRNRNRNRMT